MKGKDSSNEEVALPFDAQEMLLTYLTLIGGAVAGTELAEKSFREDAARYDASDRSYDALAARALGCYVSSSPILTSGILRNDDISFLLSGVWSAGSRI